MQFSFLKTALVGVTLLLSTITQAGLIIDTDNDSFIDASTGIEWMDFGVNNIYSYQYVAENIGVNQEYFGWSLATEQQVLELWVNAFFGLGADENDMRLGSSRQYLVVDATPISSQLGQRTVFDDIFDVMGFNVSYKLPFVSDSKTALGYFENSSGGLSYANYTNNEIQGVDRVMVDGRGKYFSDKITGESISQSTMLVRSALSVPEPSTLAIFAIGIIGLASRRFKKQKYKDI